MTRFGEWIHKQRTLRKMSQESAAKKIGTSRGAYSKVERGLTVRPNDWRNYVDVFDGDIEAIDAMINQDAIDEGKTTKLTGDEEVHQARRLMPLAAVKSVRRRAAPVNTVPVYGYAAAGEPDRLVMMNEITDYVEPHPGLGNVEGGYAVYVHGTSMIRRYLPGELVYVNPFKPVRELDFCVVQVGQDHNNPDGGYIKQFLGWDDDVLRLHQFNPEQDMLIPRDKVVSVHLIVGTSYR